MRSAVVGVAAEHAEPIDADGAGVVDVHRPPQAARVARRARTPRGLERAGDVAAAGRGRLGRTGHLDREDMVIAEPRERRDVETVREEVPLGVAEVCAVEPEVGLIEDPVEGDPSSVALGRGFGAERAPVHQRPVARRELRRVAPMTRNRDGFPATVVGVESDPVAANVVVGLGRQPSTGQSTTREFHRRERTHRRRRRSAVADVDLRPTWYLRKALREPER